MTDEGYFMKLRANFDSEEEARSRLMSDEEWKDARAALSDPNVAPSTLDFWVKEMAKDHFAKKWIASR